MLIYKALTAVQARLRVDDPLFIDFVTLLLKLNPDERPTATEALQHPWLNTPYEEA